MPTVSVVIPLKDERDNVGPLVADLRLALEPLGDWEAIFVDDGSTDGTWDALRELADAEPRLRLVRLRRNFGQSAAMQAGVDAAAGDIIVTMDGDRQNDPADIPALVAALDGWDIALGRRAARKDGFLLRRLPSDAANWLIRKVTGVPFRDFGCSLRAMTRDAALSFRLYGEMHRFATVLAFQQGARLTQIPVRHHPRTAGKSKYTLSRTVRVLLDLMTVSFLHAYITRPMHCFGTLGLGSLVLGGVSLSATVGMKLIGGADMTGNPLLLLSALFAIAGVQLLSLGLLGEVLSRAYFEGQGRPGYAVRETYRTAESERRGAA